MTAPKILLDSGAFSASRKASVSISANTSHSSSVTSIPSMVTSSSTTYQVTKDGENISRNASNAPPR